MGSIIKFSIALPAFALSPVPAWARVPKQARIQQVPAWPCAISSAVTNTPAAVEDPEETEISALNIVPFDVAYFPTLEAALGFAVSPPATGIGRSSP